MNRCCVVGLLLLALGAPPASAQTRWTEIPLPSVQPEFTFIDFSDSLAGWLMATDGTYAFTTDGGSTWTIDSLTVPGPVKQMTTLAPRQCWVATGTTNGTLLRTLDGDTWTSVAIPESLESPQGFTPSLFRCGFTTTSTVWWPTGRGYYSSGDLGNTWTFRVRSPYQPPFSCLAEFADSLSGILAFSGTTAGGGSFGTMLRTGDGGEHIDTLDPHGQKEFFRVRFYDTQRGFLAWHSSGPDGYPSYFGLDVTADGGKTRNGIPLGIDMYSPQKTVGCLKHPNGSTFALTTSDRIDSVINNPSVFLVTHNSASPNILAFESVTEQYNFILARGNRLFRSIDIPTAVASGEEPTQMALEQNYPNPFNGISEFGFRISEIADVQLRVCDLLGREVAVLVDARMAPGTYRATFDGSGLASGMYVCRMQAGQYVTSRKMLLAR